MAATFSPAMLPVRGKTRQHCCAPPGHMKIFGNISVQDTKFVSARKCCVRGETSQDLGNMITSAMLPPQCVLVLPAPKYRKVYNRGSSAQSPGVIHLNTHAVTNFVERSIAFAAVYLKPHPFENGSCLDVVVSEVLSPWEFWLQPSLDDFNDLMEQMW